jgi:tetratricopeptide (TPR) repeat protein
VRRALEGALLACALSACASESRYQASTRALELERWIELRTPDYTLQTNAPRAEALRMARQLSAFTDLLRMIMNSGRLEPALPMRISVFARADQFQRFPVSNAAGYAVPSLRGTRLALSLEPNGLATPVLFHEYVHFLLMNGESMSYPPWYHEGLAEMLGSTVIRGDVAFVGSVPHWRMASLAGSDEISLEQLLGTTDPGAGGLQAANRFYAEAWLLVHYLHTSEGVYGGPERMRPMLAYLRELNRGQAWSAAFASSFDVDLPQLEQELDAHRQRISRDVNVLTLTLPAPGTPAEVRALSRAESAVALAELALAVNQVALAEALLDSALAEQPGNGSGHALRALASARHQDFARAHSEVETALRMAPDDARVHEAKGDVWALRANAERDPAHLVSAREAYEHAARLEPETPAVWASLGATYLGDGDCAGVRRGIEALERARALAPWHPGIHLDLGRLQRRLGNADAAREHLLRVTAVAHGAELVEQARQTLRELDAGGQANC